MVDFFFQSGEFYICMRESYQRNAFMHIGETEIFNSLLHTHPRQMPTSCPCTNAFKGFVTQMRQRKPKVRMSLLTVFQSGDKRWTAFEAAITIHPASETAMLKEGVVVNVLCGCQFCHSFSFQEVRGGGRKVERAEEWGQGVFLYSLPHS